MTSGSLRIAHQLSVLLLTFMMLSAGGCGNADGSATDRSRAPSLDQPYSIVTTTAMIGDVVRNIVGDRAEVFILMGAGTDPHLYRPTRSDVNRLLNAHVVFYNGLMLEGRMTDTFVRVARTGTPVHAVTELIAEEHVLDSEEYEGQYDPHVWMDPGLWRKAVEAIVEVLSNFDPDYASVYRERGDAYAEQLRALDTYAREVVATIPDDRRVLVTAHDAFNYFASAYGIEVQAIQGISTDSEVGLRRIEQLVSMLVNRQIPTVFTETSVPDRHVLALIDGARARGHEVRIGGELFSDAMGEEGTYEGTYIGMIDHNVTTIVRALGGEAPKTGFRGRLSASERE